VLWFDRSFSPPPPLGGALKLSILPLHLIPLCPTPWCFAAKAGEAATLCRGLGIKVHRQIITFHSFLAAFSNNVTHIRTFSCAGFVGFAGSLTNPPIPPDHADHDSCRTANAGPGPRTMDYKLPVLRSPPSEVRPPKSVLRSAFGEGGRFWRRRTLLAKEGAFDGGGWTLDRLRTDRTVSHG
jgi:hypothetical protein